MLRLRKDGVVDNMIVTYLKDYLEKVDEKIILLAIVGTLETLKNGGITIEEAEKFLFSPHMTKKLRGKECNEKIIDILLKGCELEDIASLIPEKFNKIVDEMKQEALIILKTYEVFNESFWLEE